MKQLLVGYVGKDAEFRRHLGKNQQRSDKVVDIRTYAQRRQIRQYGQIVNLRHQILNYRTPGNGGDVA